MEDLYWFVCPKLARRAIDVNLAALTAAVSLAVEVDCIAGWYPGREDPPRLMVSTPHVLVYGAPGSGKTTLAELYAREIVARAKRETWPQMLLPGVTCLDEWTDIGRPPSSEEERYRYVRLQASHIGSFEDLDPYVYFLQAYGVILIDDIHNLRPLVQRQLGQLMHDGTWKSPYAGRVLRRMGFTIIGTTTDESKLPGELRRAFGTRLEAGGYTTEELHQIARNTAKRFGLTLTAAAVAEVVDRCVGVPGDMVTLTEALSRIVTADGHTGKGVGRNMVLDAAAMCHIRPQGDGTPKTRPRRK